MLQLKAQYFDLKMKAKDLMENGNIRAYIALLVQLREVQLQMANYR